MSDMNVSVKLQGDDQLSPELKKAGRGVEKLTKLFDRQQKSLEKLNKLSKKLDSFNKLQQKSAKMAEAFKKADKQARALSNALARAEHPSEALAAKQAAAQAKVERLGRAMDAQQRRLGRWSGELREAGVDTSKLGESQAKLAGKINKATDALEKQRRKMDRMAGARDKVIHARETFDRRMQRAGNMYLAGQGAASGARWFKDKIFGLLDPVLEVERAKGELATLGIGKVGQELQAQTGRGLERRFAGISEESFVRGAYPLKSALPHLSDQALANMNKATAITARATLSESEQMASLFGTAYGIYKRLMPEVNDSAFGDIFSAGLSASVQQFKTTGGAMQQAIESSGAGASLLGMSMSDQLTSMGMLQQMLTPGEAGTALGRFGDMAAKAERKLHKMGLHVKLLNKEGKLLPMAEILENFQDVMGEYNAFKGEKISEAFGSEEALKLIKSLWGMQDAFRANNRAIEDAIDKGLSYTEAMAKLRDANVGARFDIMGKIMGQSARKTGELFIPMLDEVFPKVDALLQRFDAWIDKNPKLARGLAMTAVGLGVLLAGIAAVLTVVGGLTAGMAMLGFAVSAGVPGATLLAGALGSVGAALFSLPALAVAAAVGLGVLVTYFWDDLPSWAQHSVMFVGMILSDAIDGWLNLWDWFSAGVSFCFDKITEKWGKIIDAIRNGDLLGAVTEILDGIDSFLETFSWYEAGKRLVETMVDGIKKTAPKLYNAVKWAFDLVSSLLTHSDADEGPFSTLTASGMAIPNTIAAGIAKAGGGSMSRALAASFDQARSVLDRTPGFSPALSGPALADYFPQAQPVSADSQSAPAPIVSLAGSSQNNQAPMTIHFAPVINVSGGTPQETREQINEALRISQHELEQMLQRIESDKARSAYR